MKKTVCVLVVLLVVASCAFAKMDATECRQIMSEAKDLYHAKRYAEARPLFAEVESFGNAKTWLNSCDKRLAEVRAGVIEVEEGPVIRVRHPSQMIHVGSGKRPLASFFSGSTGIVPFTPIVYQTLTQSTISEKWNYYRKVNWLLCDSVVVRVAGVDFTLYDTCSYYIDPWTGRWRMTADPSWQGPRASEEQIAQALHQREHTIHYTMGHVIDVTSATRVKQVPGGSGGGGGGGNMHAIGSSSDGGWMHLSSQSTSRPVGDDQYMGTGG